MNLVCDDGLPGCLGTRYSPQGCLEDLTRIMRVQDDNFSGVLTVNARGDNCCALQCKHCSSNFSPSNPAAATRGHLKRCSRYIKQQQPRRSPKGHAGSKVSLTLHDDEDLPVKKKLAWRSSIEGFIVKGPHQEQFNKQFALHIITSETPFLRAIGILGAKMPSEISILEGLSHPPVGRAQEI